MKSKQCPAGTVGNASASEALLLNNETVHCHFQTLAECTFGLPRYELICTNKRVVLRQRLRLMGLAGKPCEKSILYRLVSFNELS
jgi:hypothetical protein